MIRTWGKSRRQLAREIRRRQAAGLIGEAIGWLLVIAWRFVTGDHLDGKPRTNATWTTRGTEAYTWSGRASVWARLARWERMAIRTGAVVFAGLVRAAYVTNPGMTRVTLIAGALAFATILAAYAVSRSRRRHQAKTDDMGRARYHQ